MNKYKKIGILVGIVLFLIIWIPLLGSEDPDHACARDFETQEQYQKCKEKVKFYESIDIDFLNPYNIYAILVLPIILPLLAGTLIDYRIKKQSSDANKSTTI